MKPLSRLEPGFQSNSQVQGREAMASPDLEDESRYKCGQMKERHPLIQGSSHTANGRAKLMM